MIRVPVAGLPSARYTVSESSVVAGEAALAPTAGATTEISRQKNNRRFRRQILAMNVTQKQSGTPAGAPGNFLSLLSISEYQIQNIFSPQRTYTICSAFR